MDTPQAKPYEVTDVEGATTRAKAALHQGLWEAAQFLSADGIREYVESVLREIQSDAP